MKKGLFLMGVVVAASAAVVSAGPFGVNLIEDNGAELDVNLEETIPVDNTDTTRISPLWELAPELEAAGYAIGSRGTSGRFGSDFTIPFRGQAHFTIVNQSNPDPRAQNATGLGGMHQTFDLLALGFTEEELDAGNVLVSFGGWFAGWNGQGDSIQILVQGRSDDDEFNILDNPEDDIGSTAVSNFCIQGWTANGATGSDGNVSHWWGITNQGLGEPKLFRTTFGDGRNPILNTFTGPQPLQVPVDAADRVEGVLEEQGFRVRVVRADGTIDSQFNANQLLCGDIGSLSDGSGDLNVIDMADPGSNPGGAGVFVGVDDPFPTLPSGDNDDFVVHIEGWLDLPSGTYAVGVNSDDGMRLDIGSVPIVAFEGNRGPATTWQRIEVTEGGTYAFRLTMHERGGGSALELLESDTGSDADPSVSLINCGVECSALDPPVPARVTAWKALRDGEGNVIDPAAHLRPLCPAVEPPPPESSFTTGAWAVDSDNNPGTPDFDMNEQLITTSVNVGGHEQTRLRVHSGYKAHPDQIADIDVSADGGTTWTNVWRRHDENDAFGTNASDRAEFDELLDLDISAVADGQDDVRVRFHFYGTEGASGMDSLDNWFWIVDDVVISAVPAGGGSLAPLLNETFDTLDLPIGWQVVDGGDSGDSRGPLRTWYFTSEDLESRQQPVSVERQITIVEQEVDVNCFKNEPNEEPILETLQVVTEVDGQPILTQWTFGDGTTTNILRDQPFIFKPGDVLPLQTPASQESGRNIRFLRITLIGVREGGGDSDGYVDEVYLRLVQGEDQPGPQLVSVMDGLGRVNADTALADTFISPLGEDVPFAEFGLETDVPLETLTVVEAVSTAGGPAPGISGFVSNGDGTHVVTLDPPIAPGHWLRLDLEAAGAGTPSSTLRVWLAHQPLDVNQDGTSNIRDATAFGDEFRAGQEPRLIDVNGDGVVDVRDATAFGTNWNGQPPLSPWRNTSLPPKPE